MNMLRVCKRHSLLARVLFVFAATLVLVAMPVSGITMPRRFECLPAPAFVDTMVGDAVYGEREVFIVWAPVEGAIDYGVFVFPADGRSFRFFAQTGTDLTVFLPCDTPELYGVIVFAGSYDCVSPEIQTRFYIPFCSRHPDPQ